MDGGEPDAGDDGEVMKTCEGCRFCVLADFGYSNYTVEGTSVYCGKRLHPEAPFDRFYGTDKRLEYAEQCPGYEEGSPVTMDVDHEDMDRLTAVEKSIYDAAMATEK